MKKTLLSLALISITYCANAQVGVGTNTPQSTLDIVGKPTDTATPDGVIAPRVSIANLDAKNAAYTTAQTGAIVYVNDISASSTVTATAAINAVGYYYFDGTKWVKFTPAVATQDLRLVGTNNHLTQDAGIGSNGSSLGTGTDNIAIGSNTSNKITNASSTIAIGGSALSNLTSGQGNIAIGVQTQASTTTGTYNTAVGYNSLTQQNSYGNSTALGAYAMNNGFGNNNTAIGGYAGAGLAQNSDNTLVGANVLKANVGTNPTGNTLIGSGINPNTANITYANVVALGNNALQDVTNSATATTVTNSTFVGSNATLDATVNAGAMYATAIGAGAVVGASNSIVLGRPPVSGAAQDKVGIGTIKPTETLDVVGTARVSSLANTENKIVTADTNGKLGLLSVAELNSPKAFLNTTGTANTPAGTTKSVTIYEGPCFSTADPASSCTLKLTHYSSCGGFNQPMTTDIVVVNGIDTGNGNFLGTWKANYIDNKGYVSIASSTSTTQPLPPVAPVITYGTNTARYAGSADFAGGRCFADIKTTINADGTIKVESAKQYMYAHLVYLLSIDRSKSL